MKLTNRLISHALTLVLLLGLGVLVFHRSGLKQPFSRNAPGRAGASARQTAARERPFRAEGLALADATWPAGPNGVELRPSKTSDSGATAEPAARNLFIDGHATELGAFQGILQAPKLFAGRRIAILMIHGDDGNAIRLILTSKSAAASDDCTGTYRIFGGTGKFERAAGEGSYREAPTAVKQSEMVSIAMEGTISY